jgi:hypothetical protein
MKRIFTILFILISTIAIGQVTIDANGGMRPTGNYAAYYGIYLQGGTKIVHDTIARNNIPLNLRDTSTFLCFNLSDSTFYVLKGGISNNNFVRIKFGGGQIYNNGYGLNLDNATNTFIIDTTLLSTRSWRQKGLDSLGAITLKSSDTSAMLQPYLSGIQSKLSASDTASMLTGYVRNQKLLDSLANVQSRIQLRLNISDTSAMLQPYLSGIQSKLNIADTSAMLTGYVRNQKLLDSLTNVQSRIQLRLNISDTSAMLTGYVRNQKLLDSLANVQSRIQLRLNISDTSAMLQPYLSGIQSKLNIADTSAMLANYLSGIQSKLSTSDTSAMLTGYVRNQKLLDSLANVQSRIQLRLNISDTSAMLTGYVRNQKLLDSLANVQSRIQLRLNISDTSAMLQPYLSGIQSKLNLADSINLSNGYSTRKALIDSANAIRNRIMAATANLIDSIYTISDTLYSRSNGVWKYSIIDTFTTNPTLHLAAGKTLGKYKDGDVPNWQGMSAKQALLDAMIESVHPTYTQPSASINSSTPPGSYEIGSHVSVPLSYVFTQNDAGSVSGQTFQRNGSTIGNSASLTDDIASITSAVSYTVIVAYNQGACKNNNLGTQDCFGRVNAGSVSSNTITYTPYAKAYYGYCSGAAPTTSEILAAAGGGSFFTSNKAFGATVAVGNTPSHVFYAYPVSLGDITSIKDGAGNGLIGAFTKTTIVSFTNASGYSQDYYVWTSNNFYSNTSIYDNYQ